MHTKITCCSWDDWVLHCAPFMNTASAPSSREGVRTRAQAKGSPPTKNPFQSLSKMSTELDMYKTIIPALNDAKICPGYVFVSTPYKADESEESGQAVDCGLYPDEHIPDIDPEDSKTSGLGRVAWSWMEIAIECKMHATNGDPLDETIENDEPNAQKRREVLGQILSYAELIFKYQHRTHQYMILFLGDYFRILRIDRSGLFATPKINYQEDGLKLAHFLWYYSRLSDPALRGHDTTAERLAPDSAEADRMRSRVAQVAEGDYVAKAFKDQLDPRWPWWRLRVPNENDPKLSRSFLVGKPHFQAPGVAGRGTRGYIALEDAPSSAADSAGAKFVYLKDAWRVVHDDIEKEGAVLEFLRKNKVPYVPTLVCHGDIAGQVSLSQKIWVHFHKPEEKCNLKTHQHYRLVVEEVGKPLDQFSNGWELVFALYCCLLAHFKAYTAGIIHRDISAGNMLLYKGADGEWCGMLNDWELSKRLDLQREEGRQPDRTGTWQFLSARALNDHSKEIVIEDELESNLHVLLYIAIRLLPHNCDDARVPKLLHDFFDAYDAGPDGVRACGYKKFYSMRLGEISLASHDIYRIPGVKDKTLVFLYEQPPKKSTESSESAPHETPVEPPKSAASPETPTSNSEKPAEGDAATPPEASRVHPIDGIVQTLFSWFKAYYALQDDPHPRASSAASSRAGPEEDVVSHAFAAANAVYGEDATDSDDSSDPEAEEVLTSAKLRKRANRLSSHKPMLRLLKKALKKKAEWPVADRCPDRKPLKWKLEDGDRVPMGTKQSQISALKRGSMHMEDPPSTPSKKPRK